MPAPSSLLPFEATLKGQPILVTGHTGFTGSWTCLWLNAIGARVSGLALEPDTSPSLYRALGIDDEVDSTIANISEFEAVLEVVNRIRPIAILHLAAQPLVRRSYRTPVDTFSTNVMGTAHILEAARLVPTTKAIVCVTTDKVYQNNEWPWPYRENDPLGGKDPYSASKSAAEMVIRSYADSFGASDGTGLAVAAARGGNIIGGGDWSDDRLIPDFVRSIASGNRLTLRYPGATRPWQHVLALVQAYLMLLSGLLQEPARHARAWNFGPQDPRQYTVRDVLNILSGSWASPEIEFMAAPDSEALALSLDSSLAHNKMGWRPVWSTHEVITRTATWYRGFHDSPASARQLTQRQLDDWRTDLLRDEALR